MTRRATDPTTLARTITLPVQHQMSESELLRCVIEAAGYLGWRTYHTWTSLHSAAGFPDLVLVSVRQRRVIYAELKAARGIVSADQRAWLDDLRAAGGEAHIWRPADWNDGTIERVLCGRVG